MIVQQVCIETWFIGHSDYFIAAKSCGDRGIRDSMFEYDALNQDPEYQKYSRATATVFRNRISKLYNRKNGDFEQFT